MSTYLSLQYSEKNKWGKWRKEKKKKYIYNRCEKAVLFFGFFFLLPTLRGVWGLSSQLGIELVPPAQSLNHWTTREFPEKAVLLDQSMCWNWRLDAIYQNAFLGVFLTSFVEKSSVGKWVWEMPPCYWRFSVHVSLFRSLKRIIRKLLNFV